MKLVGDNTLKHEKHSAHANAAKGIADRRRRMPALPFIVDCSRPWPEAVNQT